MRLSRRCERSRNRFSIIFTPSIPFTPSYHIEWLLQALLDGAYPAMQDASGHHLRALTKAFFELDNIIEIIAHASAVRLQQALQSWRMPQIAPAPHSQLYSPYSVSARLGRTDGRLQQSAAFTFNLGTHNNNPMTLNRQSRDRRRNHVHGVYPS